MAVCYWQYLSGTPTRIFGNLVAEDVSGQFAFDVFGSIRLDVDGLFNPFPDVNTAFFTKFHSYIHIKQFDERSIKVYSGLPPKYQFGDYGYELVDHVSGTGFITHERQVTSPAFTWVTSDYPPDSFLPYVQCTGSSGNYTVWGAQSQAAASATPWATEAFYSFRQSVVADIQLVYYCEQTYQYHEPGSSYGIYAAI